MNCSLLAYAWPEGGSALVLRARGLDISGGGTLHVGAPQGAGLHVWEGEQRADGVMAGAWRRATEKDLSEFGVPLSQPVQADGTWCCAMRAKFLVGLAGVNTEVPMPIEFADFVLDWGNKAEKRPTLWGIKFCPFCGVKLGTRAPIRVPE